MLCPTDPNKHIQTGCPVCGNTRLVTVNAERYDQWIAGDGLIQDLLPELDAEEREALMTGLCSSCWSKMFQ